jgi:hypothetical protein
MARFHLIAHQAVWNDRSSLGATVSPIGWVQPSGSVSPHKGTHANKSMLSKLNGRAAREQKAGAR